jgi:glycosyltransferase involved in cell wall biosynthesis
MSDLSVLIPARNEMWLQNTIDDILSNVELDTEVIVVLDGYWPYTPIKDDKRVRIIHYTESVGQRAATNDAAKLSRSKYIMKCDAHCSFDKGFDKKLLKTIEDNWTVIPRMYNLHVFNWLCKTCADETYQGSTPLECKKCKGKIFERKLIWKPRLNRKTDFTRFDNDLHFQYWNDYEKRPEAQGDIVDVMSNLGACWLMNRDRYWKLGGLDEKHGSWGQMGTEISCKTWLSGGRQVVNKTTWFSHLFRTQGGDFGFPFPISDKQVQNARKHSKELWLDNKWPKAIRKIDWIINKFSPVPTWMI